LRTHHPVNGADIAAAGTATGIRQSGVTDLGKMTQPVEIGGGNSVLPLGVRGQRK